MTRRALILLVAPVLLAALPARGQSSRPSLLAPAPGPAQVLRAQMDPPGTESSAARAAAAPQRNPGLIREGTVLPDCVGRLVRTAEGQTTFTFDPPEGHAGKIVEPNPMPVLPNLQLLAMESAVANTHADARFRVTGLVTEYNNRNYIMLEEASPGAFARPAPTPAPATRPTGPGADGPAARILGQLENPAQAAPKSLPPAERAAQDKTTGKAAVAPAAKPLPPVREGKVLSDRVARLTRTADGQPELTFEADGKRMLDPPMIVLPNLKLTQMESALTAANRDLRFRVTGLVTEYKARNYILLDKCLVIPEGTRQF